MKAIRVAILTAAIAIPSVALAQDENRTVGGAGGALGGAAGGTVVGGPVGAVVGAGVGAIVGSSLPPQPSVTYDRPVVVGEARCPRLSPSIRSHAIGNTITPSSIITA